MAYPDMRDIAAKSRWGKGINWAGYQSFLMRVKLLGGTLTRVKFHIASMILDITGRKLSIMIFTWSFPRLVSDFASHKVPYKVLRRRLNWKT